MKRFYPFSFLFLFLFYVSCQGPQSGTSEKKHYVVNTQVVHPDWTENAVIYEVNIRQYTPEGTFTAFIDHIARLRDMGVDILWIMPIHPIGNINRKGSLGSYYSVRNYYEINPEFGTLKDFKDLVKEAHAFSMYVIIDWVANHTAWDNPWVTEHPEWYKTDSLGNLMSPFNWNDVVQLNYNNPELRKEMIKAMKYWVEAADIDGYRCDVAGLVPCDFWENVRMALDCIKPVFMLAEDEDSTCLVEKAFDMNYAWELYHTMNEIAKGNKKASDIRDYFIRIDTVYDPNIYRMNFVTNHDENSWNGTEFERLGEAVETYAMLTFTFPGMPLIYSGQEIGLDKRLKFFEKDQMDWVNNKWEKFYTDMIEMKKDHSVFWNGTSGGSFKIIPIADTLNVIAFERSNDDETLVVLANLGADKTEVSLDKSFQERQFFDIFSEDEVIFSKSVKLKGYEYKILEEDF
jgi:glycosidase